jgi:hypothetical protein
MKMKNLPLLILAATVSLAITGCGKKSESTTSTPEAAPSPAAGALKDAANTAVTEVQKAAGEVKATAEKAVTDATATATAKAQEMIDKAKSLVGDKKYQDALTALQQLGGMTLSPEQQKLVDDLKKTIQTALGNKAATDGAGAVQNLLNK